jgi:cyclophilin family peptidyl-prolyl cis-trans isomerase/HEAT repeat protein
MKKSVSYLILIAILFLQFFSCVPPENKPLEENSIDYNDKTFRKIIDFTDKRELDSIMHYLASENSLYRYAAIKGLVSIQDSSAAGEIVKRLNDQDPLVRETAAYCMGLIGNSSYQDSLMSVFGKYDTINPNSRFNEHILESIGRIGNTKYLRPIATISTYRPSDSLLILGQVKALYRFAYRKKIIPEGTQRIVEILTSDSYPLKARYYASNYLLLCEKEALTPYKADIFNMVKDDSNIILKKNSILALGKTANPDAMIQLKMIAGDSSQDASIRQSAFKALKNFQYADVIDVVVKVLLKNDPNISYAAADYIYTNGITNTFKSYKELADIQTDWKTKTRLYAATLKYIPNYYGGTKLKIEEEIKILISQSANQYEKAAYIKALGEDINSYQLLNDIGFKSDNVVMKTASVEALGSIMRSPAISNLSKGAKSYYAKVFFPMLDESLLSKDPGLISASSDAILNSAIDFTEFLINSTSLKTAKISLKMPRDAEAMSILGKLDKKIFKKNSVDFKIKYNNTIDWAKFDELNDSVKVLVSTNKGDFEMVIFKKLAPGSVMNFIQLSKTGFFTNRYFHRVVPDFVIQTGCPRGDGYGSPDLTVRTEISAMQFNDEGLVGMASAGKDTESSQWFITLGPTPHLDGNYTVFGRVSRGMDIVKKIEIGDMIKNVKIKN